VPAPSVFSDFAEFLKFSVAPKKTWEPMVTNGMVHPSAEVFFLPKLMLLVLTTQEFFEDDSCFDKTSDVEVFPHVS